MQNLPNKPHDVPQEAYRRIFMKFPAGAATGDGKGCIYCGRVIEKESRAWWAHKSWRNPATNRTRGAGIHSGCWSAYWEARSKGKLIDLDPNEPSSLPTVPPVVSHPTDPQQEPPAGSLEEALLGALKGRLGPDEGQVRGWVEEALSASHKAAQTAMAESIRRVEEAAEKALGGIPTQHVHRFEPIGVQTEPGEFTHKVFPRLVQALQSMESWPLGSRAILLWGPSGTGKTTMARKALDLLGYSVQLQGAISDPYADVKGFVDAMGKYNTTSVREWAGTEKCGLILDEIDASDPRGVMPISDALAGGVARFPDGEIQVPQSNVVICTANTNLMGATALHVGAQRLDQRILDRVSKNIRVDLDEGFERQLALSAGSRPAWVDWCQGIRKEVESRGLGIHWSPRATFSYCRDRASGLEHDVAVQDSVIGLVDEDARKGVLAAVPSPS